MKISVVTISSRGINEFKRVLAGLKNQTILPDEWIVIRSQSFTLPTDCPFKLKEVKVKSLNQRTLLLDRALKHIDYEIICFLSDDTLPHEDWLEKIIETYKNEPMVGAVGGRDEIYRYGKLISAKKVKIVGKLTWFGRIIGNHHEVLDRAQEVDFLKGCNMSVRKKLILEFDKHVLDHPRWEQDVCFKVKAKGYKLIYDPEIKVKHFKGEEKHTLKEFFIVSHNTTYLLLKYLPLVKKLVFIFYTFLVGQRNNLGFLRSALLPPSLRNFDLASACLRGKIRGVASFFIFKLTSK